MVKARAAMSQWILKTLYLAGGSGTEKGGGASVRGRDGRAMTRRAVGPPPQGPGHYVFLQRTDTQKMPAARKQADMTMYNLKRGISAADRKPSGFFSRIMTWGGGSGGWWGFHASSGCAEP